MGISALSRERAAYFGDIHSLPLNKLIISAPWGTDLCKEIFKQLIKVSHGNPLPDRVLVQYRLLGIFMSHIKGYHDAMNGFANWGSLILIMLYFKILKVQRDYKKCNRFHIQISKVAKSIKYFTQLCQIMYFTCVTIISVTISYFFQIF